MNCELSQRSLLAIAFFLGLFFYSFTGNAEAQTIRTIDFSETPNAITISSEGIDVTLQPIPDPDGNIEVIAAINAPGFQSIIVKEASATSAYYERIVAIGKLAESDETPSILLQGFTGGAHCCATLRVITPVAGKLKVLDFPFVDGGPEAIFPKDIDGDGVKDFLLQDDSFRYQFASGAGSYSPPVIMNIYRGQIVDLSDQPAYMSVWQKFATETRTACSDTENSDRNGACIAFVAAGARLDKFASHLSEATKFANNNAESGWPESCEVGLVDYECPAGKEIKFYTFESAAIWFLREQGYIE